MINHDCKSAATTRNKIYPPKLKTKTYKPVDYRPALLYTILVLLFLAYSQPSNAETYGARICADNTKYLCYKVKRGESWEKLFPDSEERDVMMRLNRMNTRLFPGLVLAEPRVKDDNILDYSPLPKQIDPPGDKLIVVSIHDLAFGAYDSHGTLEHWGPISAARGYCPDIHRGCHTATGSFVIFNKLGRGCASTRYPVGRGGAPMPYCMFFHGNFALHGSYEVPGYNASHGCVRMFIDDAKWLNQDFTNDHPNTHVIIQ